MDCSKTYPECLNHRTHCHSGLEFFRRSLYDPYQYCNFCLGNYPGVKNYSLILAFSSDLLLNYFRLQTSPPISSKTPLHKLSFLLPFLRLSLWVHYYLRFCCLDSFLEIGRDSRKGLLIKRTYLWCLL